MINRFRVSGLLPDRLEELGVSPLAVLRQAGLPMGLFNQEKVFVTTGELFALWRGIAEVSSDPAIGLKLGSEERVERYSPIAIAALYTRSFRDALQRLARYKQLTCPEEIRLIERKGECAVLFKWLLAREPEPESLVDICFACVVSIGRRGAGKSTNPVRVELKRTASHRRLFEEYFQCPVKFDAGHNALIYDAADIDRPFLTHNPELLAMVAPQLEAELAYQIAQQTVPDQVKAILKRLLAGRRPAVQDVARELRLSPRTLQRRLTEEGLTFQQLLEDARRELARHYLLHSSLELNETAYLLGYEDPNSFFRAFQHWEGATPGQWRTNHKECGLNA
ncbi:MAG TPA: AraC family transcriptional regulator [Blastocatellia bacterium]|jgi:AraC-like DNA-binding protein|nr:AraC family transcriptional regulator [Blastocatellia bacterium]